LLHTILNDPVSGSFPSFVARSQLPDFCFEVREFFGPEPLLDQEMLVHGHSQCGRQLTAFEFVFCA
jgi:hypothetical protein